GGVLPGEEGEDRAGMAGLVAIIEVVGAGIVEIDRLLDEPQAQRAGVKIEISQSVTGNGGNVVDAWHGRSPKGGAVGGSLGDYFGISRKKTIQRSVTYLSMI